MKKRYEFSLQYPKPLQPDELKSLLDLAQSGLYSRYTSTLVEEVESELAQYYGCKYAVTCTSGTAALHGCLVALDFPVGSEIMTTSVTDIGVIIPIIYENLVPVFADVDSETYNLDLNSVESKLTKNTKAIIAVHLAGNPCDIDALKDICLRNNLILVEDFSQAHGAMWLNNKVGSFGLISYGSFQQSKQITCGEGGIILTNDSKLAKRAFIGVDKGWQRYLPLEKRFYEFLAPNVRFNAVLAAILKPQISKLDKLIEKKRNLANILYKKISNTSNYIKSQKILDKASHSYYSFPMYVTKDKIFRDKLLKVLKEDYYVYCAYGYANPVPLYLCVNALMKPKKYGKGLYYSKFTYPEGTCPHAEQLLEKSFLIPFNENYTEQEINDIGDRVLAAINDIL